MKKYIYLIVSVLSITLLLGSCKENDLTPVYIHVTEKTFEDCIDVSDFNETHEQNFDQEQLEALKRHKFTHVNVYVNNKNLGCWQIPCKVPVLGISGADTSTLVLLPAFPISGMSNTIWSYPFLNICRQKVVLQKGTTYETEQNPPRYVYSEYARFPFFQTFSNSTPFMPSDTSRSKLNLLPVSYDGKNVGELVMSDSTARSLNRMPSGYLHEDVHGNQSPHGLSHRWFLRLAQRVEDHPFRPDQHDQQQPQRGGNRDFGNFDLLRRGGKGQGFPRAY